MKINICIVFAVCVTTLNLHAQEKGYYRTPAIYNNTVIFTAEGDLWKYEKGSITATRLTTNPGMEMNPAISPDGKLIAFIGEYEGTRQLYVMPITGGLPRRLTYISFTPQAYVSGWAPDGKILFRSMSTSPLPSTRLHTVDSETGNMTPVPLADASFGSYDEKGILYFTRYANQGSKTKRYMGGSIEQIWKFDGKNEARNLTGDYDGTSTSPMYFNNRVYFLSDKDGTMNIWSMNKEGQDRKQHTFSSGWDLQSPYLHNAKIVYQKGADIYLYDITKSEDEKLDISLSSDFEQRKTRWMKSPVNSISASDISPNGNYAAIISRGRLFIAPAKSDRWVEVSRQSGIRYKSVQFYKGTSLAVLSDQSGEYEVWEVQADGPVTPRQITRGSKILIQSFNISPDGKNIAYLDKNDILRVADTDNGKILYQADSAYNGYSSYSWSPDSRYLSYVTSLANLNQQIQVLNLATLKSIPITTSRLDSYNAAWSPDKKWLYFISDRNLKSSVSSPWGPRQPEPYYNNTGNIFALQLDEKTAFPFLPTDSWLKDSAFTKPSPDSNAGKKMKSKKAPLPAKIMVADWAAISSHLYQVPGISGNLDALDVTGKHIYWLEYGEEDRSKGGKLFALKIEENKKAKPEEVAEGVTAFSISADRSKVLLRYTGNVMAIANADGMKIKKEDTKISLDKWAFSINPVEDWKQLFDDAWRMMRDYFYDRNMHQVNWVAVRNQYEPLVARVTDREELDDLIGQMVGELSTLHTFVYGPDTRKSPDIIKTASLGASLEPSANGIRISHIYKTDQDYPEKASPLQRPGQAIKEGDLITAVNNFTVKNMNDLGQMLANKDGIPVKLTLKNATGKIYEEVVNPISDFKEYIMRYEEWELERRERVDSLGGTELGYVHLKAMGGDNMDEFVKQFYPVFNRKGLIIDVRHNFGGNIDSWILEKLMRKAWMYWQARAGGTTWNMQYAFRGPMIILCDQITSSDGEAVAEGFRRLGLGKVIGMRTWGGEVWLTQSNRLVDNGIASAAEIGVYGPEGKWLIEGRGVEPDIEVDNLPFATYKGKDAQLEFAVDYLLKEIKKNPLPVPPVPMYPDKSFDYKKKVGN
ncbi:MAG: S41 family peptidase [Ferruginibacter sp.]